MPVPRRCEVCIYLACGVLKTQYSFSRDSAFGNPLGTSEGHCRKVHPVLLEHRKAAVKKRLPFRKGGQTGLQRAAAAKNGLRPRASSCSVEDGLSRSYV